MKPARASLFGILGSLLAVGGCGSDSSTTCPTESGTGCAPESQRADLYEPAFSNPTQVTHPLYPISDLHSVVFAGVVDGEPFRTETTLLPGTRMIEWNGKAIETLQSQYMAFSGDRLEEVAIDWYAQDDRGAVWYFGEDVSDYDETGAPYTHEGTWLVGRNAAPPAMIMDVDPQVNDAWLAENVPPDAWEQITVVTVDVELDGPAGRVTGGVIGSELHLDGETEEKVFAPGYGEFSTGSLETDNLEALALAIPTDALTGAAPADLDSLASRSAALFQAAGSGDWTAAEDALADLTAAWDRYRAGQVPPLLAGEIVRILDDVAAAVTARDPAETRDRTIALARPVFDLRMRHTSPSEIDAVRFDLWLAQIEVDVTAGEPGDVKGDVSTLELVLDRFAHTLDASLAESLRTHVADLRTAADAEDLAAAATAAGDLHTLLGARGWR